MYMFRDLRADEIECRVAQATKDYVSLLLYKNARCDQNILDETVGAMNWQRAHTRDNANCIVSIWDKEKGQWIGKEDTGAESNSDPEKGLASDSFKRACVNWGIGRELYTAPPIFIKAADCVKLKQDGQKWKCKDIFVVESVEIIDKCITKLKVRNNSANKVCFSFGATTAAKPTHLCADCGAVIKDDFIANGTMEAYGRYLCRECGLKAKRARDAK